MSETTPSTTTATGRASTKAKVEKEPRHQQTLVAVEADFSGPTPEDCRGAETNDLGSPSISSILQREPSALLQRRTSSTQHLSASPFSSPTPIPFSGKLFTHIPTHSSRPPVLQPKLTVGAAHDAYEEEADQVAEQIMRLPIQNLTGAVETDPPGTDRSHGQPTSGKTDLPAKPAAPLITPLVHRATTQRKEDNTAEAEDEEEETQTTELVQRLIEDDAQIQPKRVSAAESFETGVDFEKRLGATRDRGRPLPEEIRTFMEPRFQVDFSGVRVHDDHEAGELNRAVSARAFTLGQDIYLGEGQANLNSDGGKRLLAHELTHVVQQNHANQLRRSPEDEEQPDPLQTETPAPEPAQPDAIAEDSPQIDNEEATHLASQEETEQAAPTARTPGATAEATPSQAPSGPATQAFTPKEATTAGTPDASDRAPRSPQEDGAFQAVTGQVKQVTAQEKTHAPAQVESAHAQAAAVPPANEITSKAQDQHVQELEQQKPGEFNAAAFKAALLARIQDIAPKTLKEADEFKSSNKLKSVKESAKTEVADGKKQATGPLEENAQKEPDPSGIEPKRVNPLKEPQVGPPPAAVGAEKATPKPKGQSEVEAPLQQGSQSLDQQMAAADVTEEQLAESNEPEFEAALTTKRQAQTSALESPQAYRKQETQIVAGAQNQAQASAATQLDAMHGERDSVLKQVTGLQGETKSSDEDARATVANAIAPIYEKTKQDVEVILDSLDTSVSAMFDAGAEKARKQFEDYVDQRIKAYKKKRYGGLFGWAKWLKDKLAGMPSEVNVFYEEGRKLYIQVMDGVLDGVAAHVTAQLNEAKARIAQGRQEIQAYVAQLPEDLQQIGAEAAQEMQGKFDELEQSLSDKQTELIDDLAQKYQDNLKEIDARIEELKAANAGLIAKAINFIKNVILTIVSLAAMLLKILAKAAAAVPKIILNPINFVKNLIQGVKQGLHNFVANIGTHIGQGIMGWLGGQLGQSGIQLPTSLDAKSIFNLVLQMLDLSWSTLKSRVRSMLQEVFGEKLVGYVEEILDYLEGGVSWAEIRPRLTQVLGKQAVEYLEKGMEIFQIIKSEGLSGLWEYVKDQIGDLSAMFLDEVKQILIQKVIKAGMKLLMAALAGPAGGFIKAIETIINIVKWFLANAKKLMELVDSILDAILAIASGSVEAAAQKIEATLAGIIPKVISFLASLVGIDDLGEHIRKALEKIRKPVSKAVDWTFAQAKKGLMAAKRFVKKVGQKLGLGKEEETEEEKQERLDTALTEAQETVDARFGGTEARKSDVEPILVEVKQKYALKELLPVARGDVWAIYGKVNPEEEKKTKARVSESGGFAINAFPGSVVTLGSKVQYRVEHTYPKLISADSSYHYQWFIENDQNTVPASQRHLKGPSDVGEWTLTATYPGNHYVCAKIFLDDNLVATLGYEQRVEKGGDFAIKAYNDPVVEVGSKVKYSVVKGERETPFKSEEYDYNWVIEDDPGSTPASLQQFRETFVNENTVSARTKRPGILRVTVRVSLLGELVETVSLKQKVATRDERDSVILGWIHTALDVAGLIPALGAIPDGINAGIYLIEGDWGSAGISAVAMVPIFGEGATVTKYGVRITRESVERLGREGVEKGIKEVVEAAGKKGVKEVGEKALRDRVIELYGKKDGGDILQTLDELADVDGAERLLDDVLALGSTAQGALSEIGYAASLKRRGVSIEKVGDVIGGKKAGDILVKNGPVIDVKDYHWGDSFFKNPKNVEKVKKEIQDQVALHRKRYPGRPIQYAFTELASVPSKIIDALKELHVDVKQVTW